MNDKVWVLRCSEPYCEWTMMVPREAKTHHRQSIIARHRAEAHHLLPEFLTTAIEAAGVRVICLRGTHREAEHEMKDALDLLVLAGFAEYVKPSLAHLRIDFANNSRAIYMGGDERHLEQRLRGQVAVYIDGTGHAYDAANWVLAASVKL